MYLVFMEIQPLTRTQLLHPSMHVCISKNDNFKMKGGLKLSYTFLIKSMGYSSSMVRKIC